MGKATAFGDEWLECEIREKREHKRALLPTGSQVVPIVNYKLALTKDGTTKAFAICLSEIEPRAAIAVDLQQPLREFRMVWGTLCSCNLVGQVFR